MFVSGNADGQAGHVMCDTGLSGNVIRRWEFRVEFAVGSGLAVGMAVRQSSGLQHFVVAVADGSVYIGETRRLNSGSIPNITSGATLRFTLNIALAQVTLDVNGERAVGLADGSPMQPAHSWCSDLMCDVVCVVPNVIDPPPIRSCVCNARVRDPAGAIGPRVLSLCVFHGQQRFGGAVIC